MHSVGAFWCFIVPCGPRENKYEKSAKKTKSTKKHNKNRGGWDRGRTCEPATMTETAQWLRFLVLCETETPELDLLQPEKCTRATLSELLLCLVPVPISSLSNDLFSKPRPRLAILDSKLVSEGTKINASRVSVTKKGKQAEASTGVKRQKLTLREEQVENAIKYKENIIVIEKDGGMKEFECRLCQVVD